MKSHENSARALRRAAWQGAGRMLGALLAALIVAVILYPLVGQGRHSSPDPVPPVRIAYAIQAYRKETDEWPYNLQPVRRALRALPFSVNPRIAFLPLKIAPNEGVYAIAVDGNLEIWRISAASNPRRIGAEAVSGALRMGA